MKPSLHVQIQVGGYGVGFKAGSIAIAHTAVVVTRKNEEGKMPSFSIAVLSNKPFEDKEGSPPTVMYATKLCHPGDDWRDLHSKGESIRVMSIPSLFQHA